MKCSSFYECVKDAYLVSEEIADKLAVLLTALEYGADGSEFVMAAELLFKHMYVDMYELVQSVKEAVKMLKIIEFSEHYK
jgi:deoxyribose-phosphate aldolase